MATALAKGLVATRFTSADAILASDPSSASRDAFSRTSGARGAASNNDVVHGADVLVLAVKPGHVAEVLTEIRAEVQPRHLIISIAAGVPLKTLIASLGSQTRLARVMPNTPCLVGQSASAFALGPAATAADGQTIQRLLEAVGAAHRVDEKLLDAVTGLSGSGPAFVFVAIEALSDGGVRMGLPRDGALALAAQTVKGAAEMVLSTGLHPAVLKDQVASPGGTTIAGLAALEKGGVRSGLIAAVEAATRRSIELGSV